jgi:glucokinase
MFIACDIGGTKFRVAKSDNLTDFGEPVIEETPDNPKDGIKFIIETIEKVADGEEIEAIIFGIAGVLNRDHSFLLKSPHLPEWERVPLKEKFEKAFSKSKIYIENDTDIVGLGEAMDGAGRGFEIVVYITISTGIGGAKIVNGKFERNRFGFEPGHQILNNETKQNWEDLASGTAVENLHGVHPKEVAKTPSWDKIEDDIAIGLHNSIVHWSPDVVVVGGSMAKDLDADELTEKIGALMKIHPEIPEIRIAELGSIGGIHGGFAFLRQLQ